MTSQSSETTRLHITPLTPDLLPLVLSASARSLATDISFHDIPTFPENSYGYVTLPTMEADKIKKKLNGSILKGRKFKVDPARPQKRQAEEADGQNVMSAENPSSSKKSKKSKKRKAEENVMDGYELPSDRKVKRGWTESSDDKTERRKKEKRSKEKEEKKSKPQSKSKFTEKEECLFRTKVPANKSSTEDQKSKKSSKKKSPESVVHEFSQTMTHPTFLRSTDGDNALTSTFEEGKGWVDESGNLKEPAAERVRKDQYRPGQIAGHKEKPKTKAKSAAIAEDSTKDKSKHKRKEVKAEESSESEDWTSSSGSSSESEDTGSESDDSETDSSSGESEASDLKSTPKKQQQPVSGSSEKEESEPSTELESTKPTESESEQRQAEVHPLEALFKRPADQQKPDPEPPAQFSFFGQGDVESGDDDEDEAPANVAPLTPFTKRDIQDRGLRSAAPTPDTSQIARIISWDTPDERDGEASLYTDSPLPRPNTGPQEESDFAKWFWENRGDNNRAWKKRRRDAAKEQRQRENRRKGMKGKS